jgi:hypothetical protein
MWGYGEISIQTEKHPMWVGLECQGQPRILVQTENQPTWVGLGCEG